MYPVSSSPYSQFPIFPVHYADLHAFIITDLFFIREMFFDLHDSLLSLELLEKKRLRPNIPAHSHPHVLSHNDDQRASKRKCQGCCFFCHTETSVIYFFIIIIIIFLSLRHAVSGVHVRACRLFRSRIRSRSDRRVGRSNETPVYERAPRAAPEAEAVGSLAGSVGKVVRAGAARQRGYSSAAVSAESRGCMTHPINGSLAAFRRRRTCYTSSLQRESLSLLLSLRSCPADLTEEENRLPSPIENRRTSRAGYPPRERRGMQE